MVLHARSDIEDGISSLRRMWQGHPEIFNDPHGGHPVKLASSKAASGQLGFDVTNMLSDNFVPLVLHLAISAKVIRWLLKIKY